MEEPIAKVRAKLFRQGNSYAFRIKKPLVDAEVLNEQDEYQIEISRRAGPKNLNKDKSDHYSKAPFRSGEYLFSNKNSNFSLERGEV